MAAEAEPLSERRPSSVQSAVGLMYVSALLGLVSGVIGATDRGDVRKSILRAHPHLSGSSLHNDVNRTIATAIVVGIIALAGWFWMAVMNGKGVPWARVVVTVLVGVETLYFVASLTEDLPTSSKIYGGVSWVVDGVIIVLLWMRASTVYFKRRTQQAR